MSKDIYIDVYTFQNGQKIQKSIMYNSDTIEDLRQEPASDVLIQHFGQNIDESVCEILDYCKLSDIRGFSFNGKI